jgi:nicotinate phosphoribosyltransferase
VKLAGEKSTLPGKKEVYRVGTFQEDVIQLASERKPGGDAERLLKPVVVDGRIVPGSLPPLSEIWEFASRNLKLLPERYHRLERPDVYPVRFSRRLEELRDIASAAQATGSIATLDPKERQAGNGCIDSDTTAAHLPTAGP